jgi:Fic family protein
VSHLSKSNKEDLEMKKAKIKINPVTMEIEIEVSDSFLKKYLQKLTDRFPKSKQMIPEIKSIKTWTEREPKVKTVKTKKTKKTPVVKGKRGSIQETILERIKMGNEGGVSVSEIVALTGLKKIQIYETIKTLKSKGIVKSIGIGKYMYVGNTEVKG